MKSFENILKCIIIISFLVGCNNSNLLNNEEAELEININNPQNEIDRSDQNIATVVTDISDYYDLFMVKFEELIDYEYNEYFSSFRYGWTGYQIQADFYSLIDASDTEFKEICQNLSDDINEIIQAIDYSPTGWIRNDIPIVICFYINDCYKTYSHEIDRGCFKHYDSLRIRIVA